MAIRFEPKPTAGPPKPAKPEAKRPAKPAEAPAHAEAPSPPGELPFGKSPAKPKPKRGRR